MKNENGMKCLVCLITDSKSVFIASGFRIQDSGRGLLNIILLPGNLLVDTQDLTKYNSEGTPPCTFNKSAVIVLVCNVFFLLKQYNFCLNVGISNRSNTLSLILCIFLS